MAAINKYRYLQAIFVGIPMSFLSLFYGSKSFFYEKNDILNNYDKNYGVVTQMFDTVLFDEETGSYYDVTKIYLDDSSTYFTRVTVKRNQIKTKLKLQDTIRIYFEKNDINEIKAIYNNDLVIVDFKKSYWVGVLFILWGLFWLIISILYIFKHPEDLKGEEETE